MKTVTVRYNSGHAYTMQVSDGRHDLLSDEPLDEGGDDLGPTPYELLASLGSCMAITLLMYARRKQWPVEDVGVSLSHEKVLPADCTDCTPEEIAAAGPSGRIDLIRTNLSVRGDLTPEQTARLLGIAQRCPIHRTLERPPKIVASISHA